MVVIVSLLGGKRLFRLFDIETRLRHFHLGWIKFSYFLFSNQDFPQKNVLVCIKLTKKIQNIRHFFLLIMHQTMDDLSL